MHPCAYDRAPPRPFDARRRFPLSVRWDTTDKTTARAAVTGPFAAPRHPPPVRRPPGPRAAAGARPTRGRPGGGCGSAGRPCRTRTRPARAGPRSGTGGGCCVTRPPSPGSPAPSCYVVGGRVHRHGGRILPRRHLLAVHRRPPPDHPGTFAVAGRRGVVPAAGAGILLPDPRRPAPPPRMKPRHRIPGGGGRRACYHASGFGGRSVKPSPTVSGVHPVRPRRRKGRQARKPPPSQRDIPRTDWSGLGRPEDRHWQLSCYITLAESSRHECGCVRHIYTFNGRPAYVHLYGFAIVSL